MSHVFVSYSRKDKACAAKIARQLEAQGFRVWIDLESIEGGDDWRQSIQEAIPSAEAVILLWSQNSKDSDAVRREIELAGNERFTRPAFRIIPMLHAPLDTVPLWDDIKNTQAVPMYECSEGEILRLAETLGGFIERQRQQVKLDPAVALKDQPGVLLFQGLPLAVVPYMESIYCQAQVIAAPEATLNAVPETIQVFLEFLGSTTDAKPIAMVYQHIQREYPGQPFFMLHVRGPHAHGNLALPNAQKGEWLDAVITTYQAIEQLVGRGGAVLQLFSKTPTALNFAIGLPFYRFWRVQIHNLITNEQRYQLVLDTGDLSGLFR